MRPCHFVVLLHLATLVAPAQQLLPDGPGRAETERLCKGCHEVSRSVSKRQDRDAWIGTMNKMVAFGMKASEQDYALVLEYLARHFPAGDVPRVNVNTASAIELESGLSLKRSQARAVIAWREAHGAFKSLEDLKKVPNLDAAHLEDKKDRIAFE